MTDKTPDLDAIRERLEAITPGEWRISEEYPDDGMAIKVRYGMIIIEGQIHADKNSADAEFIAHAPTAFDWCIKRIEALEAEATLKKEKVDHYVDETLTIAVEQQARIDELEGALRELRTGCGKGTWQAGIISRALDGD